MHGQERNDPTQTPVSEGTPEEPDRRAQTRRKAKRTRLRSAIALLLLPFLPLLLFQIAVWSFPFHDAPAAPSSTLILDRNGAPLFASSAIDDQWRIPLTPDQINPDLLTAIIAIEDARFYDHAGVDWRSALGAAWEDARHMAIRRGASTITMQLAHLREPRPRTFAAKIEQAIRAEQIERRRSKRDILVEYLNRAPFGGNLVGAGAASWRYFGNAPAQLSLAQCALLAGLPQAPNRLRPDRYPERARQRRDRVLDRMLELHLIPQARHDQAIAEPIDAKWLDLPQDSPVMRDGARGAMQTIAALRRGETVRTTIDSSVQSQATRIARQRLDQLESSGVDSAAIVVLGTARAELLATVSVSREARDVDLARSPRSTGSTLKPFIYAAAFDAGICAPKTLLADGPGAWPGYEPANYDRQFKGQLTAAEALAASRNLPAMYVLSRVGVSRCIEILGVMGFRTLARTPARYGLPLAIGGADATPLELAEAYATLARGGSHRQISDIARTDEIAAPHEASSNSINASDSGDASSVLLRDACFAALGAIADPDRTAQICREATRSNVAWKTGTSSGHRDAWCAAVTRRLTVVAWFGNAGGRGSAALVGADAAAPAALALIAALDPVDDPWPETHLRESPARPIPPTQSIAIAWPADGAELIMTGEKPHAVEFRAAGGDSHAAWWFVDDTPLGIGSRIDWPPILGRHEIRLIDDAGHSATARVRIR